MKKVFTLIELLVIITIIAILTSLLFSAMEMSKTKMKETQCRLNLKYLGESIIQYNSDNANYMPEGSPGGAVKTKRYFVFDIAPYLNFKERVYPNAESTQSLWYKHPSLGIDIGRYEIPDVLKCGFREDDSYISYGWNNTYIKGGEGLNEDGDVWKRIRAGRVRPGSGKDDVIVKDPALQMVLGDSSSTQTRNSCKAGDYADSAGQERISERHVGKDNEIGGNYLFMDQHVEWKAKSFLSTKESKIQFWSVYR